MQIETPQDVQNAKVEIERIGKDLDWARAEEKKIVDRSAELKELEEKVKKEKENLEKAKDEVVQAKIAIDLYSKIASETKEESFQLGTYLKECKDALEAQRMANKTTLETEHNKIEEEKTEYLKQKGQTDTLREKNSLLGERRDSLEATNEKKEKHRDELTDTNTKLEQSIKDNQLKLDILEGKVGEAALNLI